MQALSKARGPAVGTEGALRRTSQRRGLRVPGCPPRTAHWLPQSRLRAGSRKLGSEKDWWAGCGSCGRAGTPPGALQTVTSPGLRAEARVCTQPQLTDIRCGGGGSELGYRRAGRRALHAGRLFPDELGLFGEQKRGECGRAGAGRAGGLGFSPERPLEAARGSEQAAHWLPGRPGRVGGGQGLKSPSELRCGHDTCRLFPLPPNGNHGQSIGSPEQEWGVVPGRWLQTGSPLWRPSACRVGGQGQPPHRPSVLSPAQPASLADPPPVSHASLFSLPAGHQEALQPHPGGDLPLLLVPPPDQQPHLLHRRAGKGHPRLGARLCGGQALAAGGGCLSPGLFLGGPTLDCRKISSVTAAGGILSGVQTPPWL